MNLRSIPSMLTDVNKKKPKKRQIIRKFFKISNNDRFFFILNEQIRFISDYLIFFCISQEERKKKKGIYHIFVNQLKTLRTKIFAYLPFGEELLHILSRSRK